MWVKKMNITKKDKIITIALLLVAAFMQFLPKAGKTALYESLFGVLTIFGMLIYYCVLFLKNKDSITWNWAKDWYLILIAIVFLAGGTYMTKGIITDAANGPKTHILTDAHCVKSQGTNIAMLHYYLVGIDENGKKVQLEMNRKDAECFVARDSVTVTYYENIKKVYKIGNYSY